jgi:Kef-type K+ transport system membrane component KefB
MSFLEYLHKAVEVLPTLARFALCMMLIVIIPRLARRVRLPEAVGLLLAGVLFGPHVLDIFPQQHPVLQFFSEVGMLLLMFFAGLELDLTLFRQKIYRSLGFGVVTTQCYAPRMVAAAK